MGATVLRRTLDRDDQPAWLPNREVRDMVQNLEDRMLIESSKIDSGRDVDRLEDRLAEVEGVRDVEVKPDAHTVEIIFDPTVVSATALQSEVESLGYSIDHASKQGAL